jgi:O-antigen/teichoic acid export membrane protein
MYILVTGGIFNLILSLLLVKVHGIFGITLSVVTTEFLLLILGVYYFRKYSG